MTTKTMSEWDEVPERSVDFDDFEKFKEEVIGVFECIYEENLIYKPHGRVKYLVETFPNMKRQVLIDILKFAVNGEWDEVPERSVEEVDYCDDEVNDEEELDNFIEILYKYR